MGASIRVCAAWTDRHDRPVYTLDASCPRCGGPSETTAPAPFDPTDRYGAYRRALKRRSR